MPKAYRESANPNAAASFPYLVREVAHGRSLTFDPCFHAMHWHADVQFIYVADGAIDVATLQTYFTVKRGEAIFLSPNIVHCVRASQTAHYYNIRFPADQMRFAPGSPANDDLAPLLNGVSLPAYRIAPTSDWAEDALAVLSELVRFTVAPPPTHAASVLVRLLWLLVLLREHVPLASAQTAEDPSTLRTKHVLHYISAHYTEDLTLDDLAQSAACSKSACLRAFRTCMKTTPYKYLIEYRLEQAALLLRQTQTPIAEIAEAVGFHQFSLFGKSFKQKTGMTPKAYRLEQQGRA